jgi:tetratricopeptide (TPR) repeat protein
MAAALAAAAIWLVHPLQTESVTYIIQRAESLTGLCYLLTLYGVLRTSTASAAGGRFGWSAVAVLSCAAGMACKEVMASAPVIALLYDRIFLAGSFRAALRQRWGLYLGLAATWGILAALVISAHGRGGSAGFGQGVTAAQYALAQTRFVARYLRLCFWPHPLIFDYGPLEAEPPGPLGPAAAVLALVALGTLGLLYFRPRLGFLGVAFFAILAPSSSIVPIVTQAAAEHRMYLPLAAVVLYVGVAGLAIGRWLLVRITHDHGMRRQLGWGLSAAACTAIVAGLGYQTHVRNRDYRTDVGLWRDTVRKRPLNARAHNNLGVILIEAEEYPAALVELEQAIALKPGEAQHYYNRGLVYDRTGQDAAALADFTRALERDSEYADAYYCRGIVHERLGQPEAAIRDYTATVELQPTWAVAFYNRGICRHRLGEYNHAVDDFTQAIELEPDSVQNYNNRGATYLLLKRFDLAAQDFSKVLELQPDLGAAYQHRAVARFRLHQYALARDDLNAFEQHGGKPNPAFVKLLTEALAETENSPDEPRQPNDEQ